MGDLAKNFSVLNDKSLWGGQDTSGGRVKSVKVAAKIALEAKKLGTSKAIKPSKADAMSRKKEKAKVKTMRKIAAAKADPKVEETTPDPIPVQTGADFGWSSDED